MVYDASVTGIVFSSDSGNGTARRAIGVAYVEQQVGLVRQARARNEVIVSMGAFQSPQLLMVSVSAIATSLTMTLIRARASVQLPNSRESEQILFL